MTFRPLIIFFLSFERLCILPSVCCNNRNRTSAGLPPSNGASGNNDTCRSIHRCGMPAESRMSKGEKVDITSAFAMDVIMQLIQKYYKK